MPQSFPCINRNPADLSTQLVAHYDADSSDIPFLKARLAWHREKLTYFSRESRLRPGDQAHRIACRKAIQSIRTLTQSINRLKE